MTINSLPSQSTTDSASSAERPTLQALLEPHAVYGDAFAEKYGAISFLATRIFGELPSVFHTNAIYPTTIKCQIVSVAFTTDVKKLSKNLQRLITIVTSLVAQCAYCSAVACGLGDVFKGFVAVTEPLQLAPGDISATDRIALRLCVAATKVPARVSPKLRRENFLAFGGEVGLQQIANILATSGFSNTFNSLLTAELDQHLSKSAEIAFKNTKYSFGAHKCNFKFKTTFPKASVSSGSSSNVSTFSWIMELIQVIRHARNLQVENQAILNELPIPTTHDSLNAWLLKKFHGGFAPRYLTKIINVNAKRAFCVLLSQTLFSETETKSFDNKYVAQLPFADRAVIAFVYFSATKNNLLTAHFAFLASSLGIPAVTLTAALHGAKIFDHKRPETATTAMQVMIPLTYYSARRYHKRVWRLAPRLVPSCDENPATVLAFCTLVSVFTMLQRYSAVVGNDGDGFENGVLEEFVASSYGRECGLVEGTATEFTSSARFSASEDEFEIDWDDVDVSTIGPAAASLRMGVGEIVGRGVGGGGDVWGGRVKY
ncbi:hypothetical protein HK100_012837 [Physocladia obscura]|uniref:Uncharacterized protein n=1 Tax=Physocladia obscura TaxID=109957 RepID=A0AAD5T203_9FUNG|nr:hypothetical protein HK100_012837 [Physocladia obscura]